MTYHPFPGMLAAPRLRLLRRIVVAVALLAAAGVHGGEPEALAISENIRARHMPFGTILDPVLDETGQSAGYSRCGDSAIWTGHYLAAEALRYRVTADPQALEGVRAALEGIRSLVEITGGSLLARCLVPVDSPFAEGILSEEAHHCQFRGTYRDRAYYWVGNTSRDQYSGVLFGLAVTFDMVAQDDVRWVARELITRLLNGLTDRGWAVVMPDGRISTVFWHRPDQQLSFLQIGRHVNPERFGWSYRFARFWYAGAVSAPIAVEALDAHNYYYKFNLAAINLFNLIRLEDSGYYRGWFERAYQAFRQATSVHGNPHFDMIDHALRGPDAVRDAQVRVLLDDWLLRPRMDEWVDLRGRYPACGQDERSCVVIPVPERVRTDFLWQRSPFQLLGGGSGRIEGAGIDYILPYWMARYYGVL